MTPDHATVAESLEYAAFHEACRRGPCRTLSGGARPLRGEGVLRYHVALARLLELPVFSVWFTDAARVRFEAWGSPAAQACHVGDLARLDWPAQVKLVGWGEAGAGPAPLLTLACAGCGCRVVIDGNHRLLRAAVRGDAVQVFNVVELVGAVWSPTTPDMNKVCSCGRSSPSPGPA
jgi:hypothetical protein